MPIAHVLTRIPLPIVQVACAVRRKWSLQRTLSTVETVLRHNGMFQGNDEV